MKKILIMLCICLSLVAKKQELSNIDPAKVFYINFENRTCNDECLKDLLQKGLYISYIAEFNSNDEKLNNIYAKLINGIDYIDIPKKQKSSSIKIAILIPEKIIKSYSANIVSPALAYLIKQNHNVYMKVFFTNDENTENIMPLVPLLQDYSFIITGFQNNGIRTLNSVITDIPVFNPLAKASNFENIGTNYTFGSIDYDEQVSRLLSIANNKVAIFQDGSALASDISNKIRNKGNVVFERKFASKELNINAVLGQAWHLNNASIFFNLPLVKTTLLATQLRALSVRPKVYLSTQINYHPMFLNLSQENERALFYFANSIGEIDSEVEYINDLLGQKIAYNWVAYSTSVGLDYYYNEIYSNSEKRIFNENFIGNSLHFKVRIMNSKQSKFSNIN